MRVLITNSALALRGGTEAFVQDLAVALRQAGHDVAAYSNIVGEAGADLLLRRISSERAEEIEGRVDQILRLFDQVDSNPLLLSVLKRKLDDLEALMVQTRDRRSTRRGG